MGETDRLYEEMKESEAEGRGLMKLLLEVPGQETNPW